MNKKTKDILKALASKKGIAAIIIFTAPFIGFAVSPEFASGFSAHLSEMLTMIIDVLPTETTSSAPTTE